MVIVGGHTCDVAEDWSVIYMGSHNCTKAAWGTKNKGQNSELGVLFPNRPGSKDVKQAVLDGLPFKLGTEAFGKERPFMVA